MTLSDGGKSRKIKEVESHASMFEEDQEGRSYPAQGSKTKAGATGKEIFKGREFGDIDPKELKRIQIDIKRSIPSHRVSTSPIRRRVLNPKTVVVSRRKVRPPSNLNLSIDLRKAFSITILNILASPDESTTQDVTNALSTSVCFQP